MSQQLEEGTDVAGAAAALLPLRTGADGWRMVQEQLSASASLIMMRQGLSGGFACQHEHAFAVDVERSR